MHCFKTILFAVFAGFALAQNSNSFNVPPAGYLLHAGQSTTFTWNNKQGSTVTLTLRDGPSGALNQGTVIASSIPNSGSYTWNVPSSIVNGNSYAIEITNDQDPSQTNFTPQFDIVSTNLVSSSASASTSGSTSASSASSSSGSASSSAASSTGSSSASAAATTASSGSPSGTSASAGAPSPTSNSAAPMLKVGGSLLAVALGFAVAL